MYRLQNQRGELIGPPFARYVDAFNHRAALNQPGLIVVERSEQS